MKHLFLINPIATRVKGRVRELTEEIEAFFRNIGADNYHIHVTRWARDGLAFANQFAAESPEPVRVHSMGGSGTLFESINGTILLPNAQIAAYPFGGTNFFIHYFGSEREHMFRSISNQVYSGVTPIDAIHCDHDYGVGFATIGLEAYSDKEGSEMIERTGLPTDFCYLYSALKAILNSSRICRRYEVSIDGNDYSNEYISILIAGGPCYGTGMIPAPEAHPNDGILDIYFIKKVHVIKLFRAMQTYVTGGHKKLVDILMHVRGKKITISAEREVTMAMDGEKYYGLSASYEVIPGTIEFVCPDGIDVNKLPRIYNEQ